MKSIDRRRLRGGLSHPSLDGYPVSSPATESIRLDPVRVLDVFQRFLSFPDARVSPFTDLPDSITIAIPSDPMKSRLLWDSITQSSLLDFPGFEVEETYHRFTIIVRAYPGGIGPTPEFTALLKGLRLREKWKKANLRGQHALETFEYQLTHPPARPSSCIPCFS